MPRIIFSMIYWEFFCFSHSPSKKKKTQFFLDFKVVNVSEMLHFWNQGGSYNILYLKIWQSIIFISFKNVAFAIFAMFKKRTCTDDFLIFVIKTKKIGGVSVGQSFFAGEDSCPHLPPGAPTIWQKYLHVTCSCSFRLDVWSEALCFHSKLVSHFNILGKIASFAIDQSNSCNDLGLKKNILLYN